MAGVFSTTTKTMLKNVIRHTTSHNKVVEESEMWQQYERMKALGGLDPSNPSYGHDDRCDSRSNRNRNGDYWNGRSAKRSHLSTVGGYRQAHMDDAEETMEARPAAPTSTYWMRQLQKLEAGDPNRWDHSGFKEMYPDDFNSDRSDSPSRSPGTASRKRKKKKSSTMKKKKKHKSKTKKHASRGKKSSRRRRTSSTSSDSESDTDSDSDSSHHHLTRKKASKHHRHRDRGRKGDPVKASATRHSSSENSDSDTPHHPPHKTRHKDRSKARRDFSADSGSGSDSVQSVNGCSSKTHKRESGKQHRNRTGVKRAPSERSESDVDSDYESQRNCHRPKKHCKHRARARSESPGGRRSRSASSGDRRTSHKHLHRKKGKKQGKERHRSSRKKHDVLKEPEDRLVVEMWKEVNGLSGSQSGDFDKRLEKEISHQYQTLKRKYSQVDGGKS